MTPTGDRDDQHFREWVRVLDEAVIQGEFGYERGEFTVYPECWRSLYDEGLSPADAWQRALDAFAEERAERDHFAAENWKRIQREDAAAVEAWVRDNGGVG